MEGRNISKVFPDAYRLTRISSGLRIEVLDYHAGPLELGTEDLTSLDLSLRRSRSSPQVLGDYRVGVKGNRLRVEVLDYHAEAVTLSEDALASKTCMRPWSY